ncbi:RNA polymerase sigma factor [Paraflavitalea pollutisoli]|uniref:RNA polymerase sigma factor n=1 Tax=Paraflavitalea pollutisoli TaxID=3034143 RepID=UPI0023ED3471|nr:sigma-70 family RNA polymerase sigma factor [Paraflavitalea sp. H1-2-19X]
MATYDLIGEKALLAQIADHSEPAFRQLFELYKSKVYSFVVAFTHSTADAEEILQETFITLWQHRHLLAQVDHPRNYIYTIVRNKTFQLLKQVAKTTSLQHELWTNLQQAGSSADDLLHLRDSQSLIDNALSQLSEQKQRIFSMSRQEGLSHDQIAAATGLSKSRVKNIIVEVLNYLKAHLEHAAGAVIAITSFIEK